MPVTIPRLTPRHWVYLDDKRTHEVHAEVEARSEENVLVTTEFPPGSRDPSEAIQAARRVAAEAEVQAYVADLEARLRYSGNYFRLNLDNMQWTPLGAPPSNLRLDLRAMELPIPGAAPDAKMGFHHFHQASGEDRLLVTMPRTDLGTGDRHVLAELSFQFPRVEEGEMKVLHTRLAPSTLQSSLVREHIEAPRKGFRKLVEARDYVTAYGEGWLDSARTMWRGAASRMLGGSRKAATAAPVPPSPGSRLKEIEAALQHPRVLALAKRFLDAGEAERIMAGGEHHIRRAIQSKRRKFDHTVAYDLAILESSMLLTYGIRAQSWSLVNEESDKLLRFAHGYRV